IEVAHIGNDPLFGVPIPEVTSAQSSSTTSPHQIVQPDHQIPQHTCKWTKDHSINNIISQLSRPVSTRLQLHEQAFFCYYDAFFSLVEPKTYKDALTQSCWIEAMQEELNEFEWLEVWKLVPRLDKVMVITLNKNLGKLQPKADIGIFIGYAPTKKAFRIYNRRTRRIVETIHVDFDELTAMASEQSSSGPALNEMTHATISSGLVQKYSSSTPYVPPSRNDWDLLFQRMFNELLNPPSIIPQDAEEDNLDIEVAHIGNDPLFGVPIPEVTSAQSSSTTSPHQIVQPDHQIPQHTCKWTKDHSINNIISQLSRPVSTRLQLHEQAFFCYYDAFFSLVEPKTYKDALTQSCWIEAMQEELNEFEWLEVWKLVPRLDKVMVITLKWIYKVKLDELGGILKKYGFESCDPVDTPMVEKSKLDEDKEGKAEATLSFRVSKELPPCIPQLLLIKTCSGLD
nr:hypothetical protein [Tanacetum cinerariifolium]